jgi:hypothetical protein
MSGPTRNNSTLTVLSLATKRTWTNRQTGERESQATGTNASLAAVQPNTPLV